MVNKMKNNLGLCFFFFSFSIMGFRLLLISLMVVGLLVWISS